MISWSFANRESELKIYNFVATQKTRKYYVSKLEWILIFRQPYWFVHHFEFGYSQFQIPSHESKRILGYRVLQQSRRFRFFVKSALILNFSISSLHSATWIFSLCPYTRLLFSSKGWKAGEDEESVIGIITLLLYVALIRYKNVSFNYNPQRLCKHEYTYKCWTCFSQCATILHPREQPSSPHGRRGGGKGRTKNLYPDVESDYVARSVHKYGCMCALEEGEEVLLLRRLFSPLSSRRSVPFLPRSRRVQRKGSGFVTRNNIVFLSEPLLSAPARRLE